MAGDPDDRTNGYHPTEQFAVGWFLLLFKQHDADCFMTIWKPMLDMALATERPTSPQSINSAAYAIAEP